MLKSKRYDDAFADLMKEVFGEKEWEDMNMMFNRPFCYSNSTKSTERSKLRNSSNPYVVKDRSTEESREVERLRTENANLRYVYDEAKEKIDIMHSRILELESQLEEYRSEESAHVVNMLRKDEAYSKISQLQEELTTVYKANEELEAQLKQKQKDTQKCIIDRDLRIKKLEEDLNISKQAYSDLFQNYQEIVERLKKYEEFAKDISSRVVAMNSYCKNFKKN